MQINILLSTYNGEKFLSQQIDSIIHQTYTDWKLLIRDDGSSDNTVSVIEEYEKKDNRIVFCNKSQIRNIGVIKSFYELVCFEEADLYFFCDQDDVWLENKLQLCIDEARKRISNIPLMVYTDLQVVNQNLELMNPSMIKTQSHHANTKLYQELTENTVTGGTAMFNHALAKLWKVTDNLVMHDWYLALLACSFGELVYIDSPTELYRQHDRNVLGARTWSKRIKGWLKPQELVQKYWHLITISQNQARHLLDLPLSEKDRGLVFDFVTILEKPLLQRIQILRNQLLRKNRWFHTLVFRTLIITKFGYRRK